MPSYSLGHRKVNMINKLSLDESIDDDTQGHRLHSAKGANSGPAEADDTEGHGLKSGADPESTEDDGDDISGHSLKIG
jgi:hypothetical protein